MLIQNFINHIFKQNENYSPSVILDVGSCGLDQSIEFSMVFSDVKIYAFEPNPKTFSLCEERVLNHSNIEIFRRAVSTAPGTLDFYVTHGNDGASSLLEPIYVPVSNSQKFTKISVESIRLDTWMNQKNISKIDILWIDTQGTDLNVLKSMGEHIKNVDFIHCEACVLPYYKNHILKDEVDLYLKSMSFQTEFFPDRGHRFQEGNIIAINERLLT